MTTIKVLAAKFFLCAGLLLGLGVASPSYAQTGIVVLDRLTETNATKQTAKQILQYVKQGQQYVTQLEQYQNMLVNTLAPVAYVWDTAQQTMSQIQELDNMVQYYTSSHGGLPAYLAKFEDVSAYSSSGCFNLNSCSSPTVFNSRSQMMTLRQDTAKGQVRVLNNQQQALQTDAKTLQRLQTFSSASVGRLQAQQAGNELASHNAHELLQIRALMVAEQSAASAKREADTQDEVLAIASRKQLTTSSFTPSSSENLK